MKSIKISPYTLPLMVAVLLLGSCATPKKITYFEDITQITQTEAAARQQIRVRPDDKLQIVVKSKDPQLSSLFNIQAITGRVGQGGIVNGSATTYSPAIGTSEGLLAYNVDQQGDIDFPVLGMVHVAGLTRAEVASLIKGELIGRDLVKDPVVTVEFLNTGVSVLGEVKAPGRYLTNRDEVTILDAIAMAGDLNIQGRRDNVRVIRRDGDTTKAYIVDLSNSKDLFNNPAYYLQQDDVVYVEPNNYRKPETTVNGNSSLSTSFWLSVTSVLTSVAVLVVNLIKK